MTNSVIMNAYRPKTPGSQRLAAEARALCPSGVTHDARILEPYGIYVERVDGPHKWDVDGIATWTTSAVMAPCCCATTIRR